MSDDQIYGGATAAPANDEAEFGFGT